MKVKIAKSLLKQAVKQLLKQQQVFKGTVKRDDSLTIVRDCSAVNCYNNNPKFKSGCTIKQIAIGPNRQCMNFVNKSQLGLNEYNQNDNPGRRIQHATKHLRSQGRSKGYQPKRASGQDNLSQRWKAGGK